VINANLGLESSFQYGTFLSRSGQYIGRTIDKSLVFVPLGTK